MSEDRRQPRVAIVGLNFGEHWVRSYLAHPDVASVAICDTNPELLQRVGEQAGVDHRYSDLDEVLASDSVDAVHLVTPLIFHAEHTKRVLNAGMHCAASVTAALDMSDLHEIVRLQRVTGRNYMMMETAAFTPEALHLKELVASGKFGDVVFGRGEHHQDMTGWPAYWEGLPPMWYTTHAIGSLLSILGTRATSVRALGAGRLPDALTRRWNNPFPAETAIYELENSAAVLEITRSLFSTVHPDMESFSLYGSQHGFSWGRTPDEQKLFNSWGPPRDRPGKAVVSEPFIATDPSPRLPEPLRRFHPTVAHAVHEFVRSIVEQRRSSIDAVVAAQWTAAGLAAHESAMSGGVVVEIPSFEEQEA